MKKLTGLIISNFNAENFANLLNAAEDPEISFRVHLAPFDQVVQNLTTPNLSDENPDFLILWTQPERIIPTFGKAFRFESVSFDHALKEVDEFCSFILQNKRNPKFIFIPTWVLPAQFRGYGMLDYREGVGLRDLLSKMNARLRQSLKAKSNIYILDSTQWIETAGKTAFSAQLWYLSKNPFGHQVFQSAAVDIRYYCKAIYGLSKKLILLDLDDTLWGGILGEDGYENLKIGGHDPLGEAYLDFQKALKSLKNRGILLAIVSKNDEKAVWDVFERHPEMILKKGDFAGWKINWKEKSQNVAQLLSELNLSSHSTVFIDDNPVERLKMKSVLPDVTAPDWPEDKMLYASTLLNLPYFDAPAISKEDLNRSNLYSIEQERKVSMSSFVSSEGWLKNLETNVICEEVSDANFVRVLQLINKTNQMNLSTRRLSEAELKLWIDSSKRRMWAFRISDKFGDLGLIGIASIETQSSNAKVIDFILSCRAMGRKIEETMLHVICAAAKQMKLEEVEIEYMPTSKNEPCLLFFQNSSFHQKEKGKLFTWSLKKDFLPSPLIRLTISPFVEKVRN